MHTLTDKDRIALVKFDSSARLVYPLGEMTDEYEMERRIGDGCYLFGFDLASLFILFRFPLSILTCSGRAKALNALSSLYPETSTNIWGGLRRGLEELHQHRTLKGTIECLVKVLNFIFFVFLFIFACGFFIFLTFRLEGATQAVPSVAD
jgi:hypothetical protein